MVSPQIPPPSPPILIEVSNTQKHLVVDQAWVERIVARTLRSEGIARASISVALVDDASIRVINQRFLSHDWATDVVSFRLSDDAAQEMAGEIVISAEMASNLAAEARSEPLEELALYLVHGLLHLCGYDDHAVEDIAAIRLREAAILGLLGITDAYDRITQISATSDESVRESVRWPR